MGYLRVVVPPPRHLHAAHAARRSDCRHPPAAAVAPPLPWLNTRRQDQQRRSGAPLGGCPVGMVIFQLSVVVPSPQRLPAAHAARHTCCRHRPNQHAPTASETCAIRYRRCGCVAALLYAVSQLLRRRTRMIHHSVIGKPHGDLSTRDSTPAFQQHATQPATCTARSHAAMIG